MTEPTELSHIHWHNPVAELGEHIYFECRCGSRRHGRKRTNRHATPKDREWLAGARREPK